MERCARIGCYSRPAPGNAICSACARVRFFTIVGTAVLIGLVCYAAGSR